MKKSLFEKELIDCGRASRITRGMYLALVYEVGWPPFVKIYLL